VKNGSPRSKIGTVVRKAGFIAAILVGLLLLSEAALRIAGLDPASRAPRRLGRSPRYLRLTADPILRYELVPGFRRRIGNIRFGVNALGMRGPEVAAAKGDRIRVAVLHGSACAGVAEAKTFVRRLESLLRAVDPRFEVLDFGVDGYDTLQDVTALEEKGLPLSPDLVLLCYNLNDIGTTPVDLRAASAAAAGSASGWRLWTWSWLRRLVVPGRGAPVPDGRWAQSDADPYGDLFPPAPSNPFLEAQFKEITENQAVFAAASRAERAQAVIEKPGRLWLNQYTNLKNIGKVRYAFDKLENLASERGFKVLIVIIPFFYEIKGRYLDRPAHRIISDEAEPIGLQVADLLTRFRSAGFGRVSRDGVNLSAFGHAVLAKALLRLMGRYYYPELERAAGRPSAAGAKEGKKQ
jgi:hypothetical protein